jgi:cold shock CspA family protein
MPKGIITGLIEGRGFGVIRTEQRKDLLFYHSEVQGVELARLIEGQEVEFEIDRQPDGRLRAVKVRLPQKYKDDR